MSKTNEEEAELLESPIFEDIPEKKRAEIARIVQKKVVPAHTILFQQGDPGDSFYLIHSGKVRIFRRDEEGLETDLSELGSGDSFGEVALLTGETRSACAEALEETHLSVLSREQIEQILSDYPRVALAFIKQMSHWLLQSDLELEREVQQQFKTPSVSWVDFLILLGVTFLCAIIFNLSNPNGIRLIPLSWSGEPVPKELPSVAMEKHSEGQAFFVDARPVEFFDEEHIRDAFNMPSSVFDILYLMELSEIDKSKEIIVYGRTISSLYDDQVARKLILRGHENVKVLQGGLSAWAEKGYPVEP